MRERGFGRIVTIASTSVIQPIPNLVISTALRSSIVGSSKTLDLDVANAKAQGKTVEEITTAMLASIPAGRYGRVQEFADVVCFMRRSGQAT
jgi:3-oxoacyl-[acyl-carrier protein] reductase